MTRKATNCGLCFVLLASLVVSAPAANILFISSMDPTHQAGEDALKSFMESLGHTVTYFDDDASQAATQAAALESDMVFISESVSSSRVGNEIDSVAKPMVITEMYVWDELGLMPGTGGSVNFETPTIEIVNPNHALAAGLQGTVTVLNSLTGRAAARFANGLVGGGGVVIARATSGGATYDVIMVYDKGVPLARVPGDGSAAFAADIRVCLGFDEQSYLAWNDNAYALLKAAIDYALGLTAKGPATNPTPVDGATDVLRDTVLQWTAGPYAVTHDVYLGTTFADVDTADRSNPKGVLVSQDQVAATYDPPGNLTYGQTYYWRIDEVNATKIYKGNVWTFTVESYAFKVAAITATASSAEPTTDVQNVVNGVGLDNNGLHGTVVADTWLAARGATSTWIEFAFDQTYKLYQMWVWNHNSDFESLVGLGIKDATIEYSINGTDWTTLGDYEFAQAPGAAGYAHNTTIDMGGILAKYVRITPKSGWGMTGQYGLSEVQFLYVPVLAGDPKPANGAISVPLDTTLTWRVGHEAASHQVYLGSDPNALNLVGTVAQNSLVPPSMTVGTTYYWRVDEVNAAEAPSLWTGNVWDFSTSEYVTIDDMESYNDTLPTCVFNVWADGFGTTTNGAQVGHDEASGGTFCERTITHGGRQSMPIRYNNTAPITNSEARRDWSTPQNWTAYGADTLSLYFRGIPVGFVQLSSDHILMNGTGTDIYGTADQGRFVYKQLTGDGTIMAKVDRLDNTNEWAKAGVMIRETLNAGSRWAYSLASISHGVHFQARLTASASATSDTSLTLPDSQTSILIPAWVKIERKGDTFNAYYSTDGKTWTDDPWNPQTITMGPTVYIGLAVTSHLADAVTQAEFSSIATTGNVTGNWLSADLGIVQPAGNTPDSLYVTVKDNAGKSATVKHPDALAVCTGAWTQWKIPFSSLPGVSANKVQTMIIGVGDASAPQHGTGTFYIDDIGFGRPLN